MNYSYVLDAYLYCRYALVKNDAVAFERSILSQNHDYKSVFFVAVNPLVPIFWDLHGNCLTYVNQRKVIQLT